MPYPLTLTIQSPEQMVGVVVEYVEYDDDDEDDEMVEKQLRKAVG